MNVSSIFAVRGCALVLVVLLSLAGCESMPSLNKRIDYKSATTTPSLELPPDLTAPQYDDRYAVSTASGLAAQSATQPKSELLPTNAEAHITRAGTQRWLIVKTTPGMSVRKRFSARSAPLAASRGRRSSRHGCIGSR